jgi:hypothetical protein
MTSRQPWTDSSARRWGSVLVLLQFGLLAVLGLLAMPQVLTGQIPTGRGRSPWRRRRWACGP